MLVEYDYISRVGKYQNGVIAHFGQKVESLQVGPRVIEKLVAIEVSARLVGGGVPQLSYYFGGDEVTLSLSYGVKFFNRVPLFLWEKKLSSKNYGYVYYAFRVEDERVVYPIERLLVERVDGSGYTKSHKYAIESEEELLESLDDILIEI